MHLKHGFHQPRYICMCIAVLKHAKKKLLGVESSSRLWTNGTTTAVKTQAASARHPATHLASPSKCSRALPSPWSSVAVPTSSALCYPRLGLTERLPVEPCPDPAVLSAILVLSCKRRALSTLHSWPEVSVAIPLSASHPFPRDLPAYFQPLPPIPWPLPSPCWVSSSRSQTHLKSFLVSGCFCNVQCSDGFKYIEINGFLSSLA